MSELVSGDGGAYLLERAYHVLFCRKMEKQASIVHNAMLRGDANYIVTSSAGAKLIRRALGNIG